MSQSQSLIQPLIDGLEILHTHDPIAPVLALGYIIVLPDIKAESLSDADREALENLDGWMVHAEYEAYAYITTG